MEDSQFSQEESGQQEDQPDAATEAEDLSQEAEDDASVEDIEGDLGSAEEAGGESSESI